MLKTAEREYTFYLLTSTSEVMNSSGVGKILHFSKFSAAKAAAERWYKETFPFEYLALASEQGRNS